MKKRIAVATVLFVCAFQTIAMDSQPCEGRLPHAFNIAIPRVATVTNDGAAKALVQQLARVVEALYVQYPGKCGPAQRIQLNIALGNDYQMLDWLGQGSVDAAIVPDLSIELLRRDNTPEHSLKLNDLAMYDIDVDALDGGNELLPRRALMPIEVRRFGGSWKPADGDAMQTYDRFIDQVWAEADGAKPSSTMIALGSHLSRTGFVNALQRVFEHKRPPTPKFWDAWFGHARFAVECATPTACFESIVHNEPDAKPGDPHWIPPGTMAILFPREEVAPTADDGVREHLLITSAAAERIFGVQQDGGRFRKPLTNLPAGFAALLDAPAPPAMLAATFHPQPQFGTRTYAFTIDESIRLLAQQQRASGDRNLALVLPGGGVKAVYQTHIAEELYGHELLRNSWAKRDDVTTADAVPVKTVIGTSGGALLGYFIAQLDGSLHNLNLHDILWRPGGNDLQTKQIFGTTDFLRYVAVVFSLVILSLVLMLTTMHAAEDQPLGTPVFRVRLTLAVMPLFVLAPVFVRWVSDPKQEQVLELLGILYMLMAICLIVADQALIFSRVTPLREDPEKDARRRRYIIGLVSVGLPLIAVPLIGRVAQKTLTFTAAFAAMAALVIGGTMSVAAVHGKLFNWKRRAIELAGAIAVVLLLCAVGWIPQLPPIVAGLGLILLGGFEYWYARSSRRGLQWLISLAAVFLIAMLCWPPKHVASGFGFAFLHERSIDDAAAFFLSLGFLLLIIGGALWTARNARYEARDARRLGAAMLVLVVYAVVAIGGLGLIAAWKPDIVTPLELTGEFWKYLTAISFLAVGTLFLLAAPFPPVRDALAYLREPHPNGTVFHRRYGRILALAVFALFWWNAVQAPALYGNTAAQKYQRDAITRFNDKTKTHAFTPTARFVTPANRLQQDGTRYFMFLAASDTDCPSVENPRASGATWSIYRSDGRTDVPAPCRPRPQKAEFASDVAFASGSPFPIFPAHVLNETTGAPDDDQNTYVDGGYSNNVPVDAARAVAAKQVLILESSNPIPPPPAKARKHAILGNLIVNSGRLLPYLFNRSQQIDRLSRNDMFVISLGPTSDHDSEWPPLFDFRPHTISQLRKWAEDDLPKRIGIVESWGRPAFTLNSVVPRVSATASPASRRDPRSPAHARLH